MAERKKEYDRVVREIIGARRVKLWDAVEKDRKAYPFSEKDWLKVEIGLEQELKELMQG